MINLHRRSPTKGSEPRRYRYRRSLRREYYSSFTPKGSGGNSILVEGVSREDFSQQRDRAEISLRSRGHLPRNLQIDLSPVIFIAGEAFVNLRSGRLREAVYLHSVNCLAILKQANDIVHRQSGYSPPWDFRPARPPNERCNDGFPRPRPCLNGKAPHKASTSSPLARLTTAQSPGSKPPPPPASGRLHSSAPESHSHATLQSLP